MAQLSEDERTTWDNLRRLQPGLDSPLLSTTMLQLVEKVRGDIHMGVASDATGPVLMTPYRKEGSAAKPFAGPLSDVQGAVCSQAVRCESLLRGWGLSSLSFHSQLIDRHRTFEPGYWACDEAPYIDISNGFEAYREERRLAKSDELKEALRKARKIQRELGPLEFEWHCPSKSDFEQLLTWKSEQLKQRGTFDVFNVEWVKRLLESVTAVDEADCRGMISCMRVHLMMIR